MEGAKFKIQENNCKCKQLNWQVTPIFKNIILKPLNLLFHWRNNTLKNNNMQLCESSFYIQRMLSKRQGQECTYYNNAKYCTRVQSTNSEHHWYV